MMTERKGVVCPAVLPLDKARLVVGPSVLARAQDCAPLFFHKGEAEMSDPYILCLRCRGTFTDEQVKGKRGCPTCGNKDVPGDTRRKATMTLTHHEWRILFMWAENWAAHCGRNEEGFQSPMSGIIREAHRQAPDLPGLTLREEVQEVANTFGEVEMHSANGSEKIKPETKH